MEELKPWERNPRTIDDEAKAALKRSMEEFGDLSGIVFNNSNKRLISGHQRSSIFSDYATIEIDRRYDPPTATGTTAEGSIVVGGERFKYREVDWTEARHTAANIAANSQAIAGEYTSELLTLLDEINVSMPDLASDLRFDELAKSVERLLEKVVKQDDVPELPRETIIQRGDIIELGRHRVLCGDSTLLEDVEKVAAGVQFDLVVTDPPYNVDYTGKTRSALTILNDNKTPDDFYNFLLQFYTNFRSHTKLGASWYVWHADTEGVNFRKAFIDAGFKLSQCLIWKKNQMVLGRNDYHWQHEPCLYGWRTGEAHQWYSDRTQTTILEFDRPTKSEEHPTMKPVDLIAYQVQNSSKAGDIVGDGFLGSGTTLIACEQLDRTCIGLELDPNYCDVIVSRYVKLSGDNIVKINGKEITWALS
jgi:DNA modification methylase